MFSHRVSEHTELRPMDRRHGGELFRVFDANRAHLRPWHPWVDQIRSPGDAEKAVAIWQQQQLANRGFHAGIWHDGNFCGVISHLNVDFANRWTALSYWLDAAHQGRGIMTECCRAMIAHCFGDWKLNRVTIECAVENRRSRAVPERLGFTLEGIIREVEWLHDRYADHAMYGLLRADYEKATPKNWGYQAISTFENNPPHSVLTNPALLTA